MKPHVFESRDFRGSVCAVIAILLLVAEPRIPHLTQWAEARMSPARAHVLDLSPQARRYLALQYRTYKTEFMGCMLGERRGDTVVVTRIAPADVDTSASQLSHVQPNQSCEAAGWRGTVGIVHSHPNGDKCWYFFPGTQVASSDQQSFARQPYPVDAIMCGASLVWMSRDLKQRSVVLDPVSLARTTLPAAPRPAGNMVQTDSGLRSASVLTP
jgi:hypothetical protein